MSLYDYQCSKCENVQEEIHSMKVSPEIKCNDCGNIMDRCISGGSGFILKGDGFSTANEKFKKSMKDKSKKIGDRARDNIKPVTKLSDLNSN